MLNQKIYKKFFQGLFFLALISPLIVDRRLFFPYVTGMALYFRVIIELLFVLWVVFILLYPEYRPKINILISSIGIYLTVLIAATFFSASRFTSFWGDAERMMGLFGVLHFFALFFIGVSLFKNKKELRKLIIIFVGISLAMCLYGILQRFGLTSIKPGASRILATLGNASTLASYLIFGLFFSLYLAFTELKKNYKTIFFISALIHLASILMTGTRGAYLGVAIGFLFASIFMVLIGFKDKKKLQRNFLTIIILLAVFYGLLFLNRNSDWVKNNLYLNRLTQFSLNDATAKTRLMAWKWGWQGFKEKPILGYGLDNFSAPFNKHFQAEYYNYAPSDSYFDRAHNIVIELLATVGIVGFISYLLVFGSMSFYLVKLHKRKNDYLILGIIGGLATAYFIQNLFIFDLLPSMLGFMMLLVFINNSWQSEDVHERKIGKAFNNDFVISIFIILAVILAYSYKNFIINPYKSFRDNIYGQIYLPSDYEQGIKYFKKSVSRNTPFDLDLRADAANIISDYYRDNNIDKKEKKDDIDFVIDLYKKNLETLPDDVYYNYKIGDIINYRFSIGLDKKFVSEAKKYIDKAIQLSPSRAKTYYLLMENLFNDGQLKKAVETAEYAVSLNDKLGDSYWELTKAYYENQEYLKAKENLIKTINLRYHISEYNMQRFEHLFDTDKSADNRIEFYELVVKNGIKNYLIPSTLANLFYEKGDIEKAIKYAEMSAEMNPAARNNVDEFIKEVSK